MSLYYYDADLPFSEQNIQNKILDYMLTNFFVVTKNDEDGQYHITDAKTGATMVYGKSTDPYRDLGVSPIRSFTGKDLETGEWVNWTERAIEYREQATKEFIATLPKVMLFSSECFHFNTSGTQYRYANEGGYPNYRCLRAVLGRINSDGKGDNHLRLEFHGDNNAVYGNNSELMLDFFELVPKAVYDNPTIPEL